MSHQSFDLIFNYNPDRWRKIEGAFLKMQKYLRCKDETVMKRYIQLAVGNYVEERGHFTGKLNENTRRVPTGRFCTFSGCGFIFYAIMGQLVLSNSLFFRQSLNLCVEFARNTRNK